MLTIIIMMIMAANICWALTKAQLCAKHCMESESPVHNMHTISSLSLQSQTIILTCLGTE